MRTRAPSVNHRARHVVGASHPAAARSLGIRFIDTTSGTDVVASTVYHPSLVVGEGEGGDEVYLVDTTTTTIIGSVVPDATTASTVADETDHEAFPGAAWLDSPTATEHIVGDRFIIVYRRASSHLTNGRIVAKIATITATNPWAYTLGTMFTIEDIANDVRVDDGVSVLDIGGGDYRAIIAAREYTGGAGGTNITPHVLICDTASGSMTSASTWTRHEVPLPTGHTQDLVVNRMSKLQNGTFLLCGSYLSGGVWTAQALINATATDWSTVVAHTIATGYTEFDIEQMPDGTLYANMRNVADTFIFSASSTDSGVTWNTPVSLFAGTHFPTWRLLTSGIGLITFGDTAGFDVSYRQTTTGSTDAGWGAETILFSDVPTTGDYATILQLDDNHVLIIYAIEATGIADPVFADIYSMVFNDSTVFGPAATTIALDDLSDVTISSATADDTLRYVGGEWINDNRRWEAVTDGTDVFVWEGTDLVHEWKVY